MNSMLNRASRQFLWQHPWQLGLAIPGIALGVAVAVVIAINLAMESALNSFDQVGKAFSGAATYRIIAGDGGLDETLYRRLRVEQGIQRLAPIVKGYVQASNKTDERFTLMGIDPFIEKSFQTVWQQPTSKTTAQGLLTRLIAEPATVLLSENTASRLKLQVGSELSIDTETGRHRLRVIGLLPASNALAEQVLDQLLITDIATDIATAQEVLGQLGWLSSMEVMAGNDQPDVLNAIRAALPSSALLVSTENQSQAIREMTRAFSINLRALGLLSLLVGMFLIYNTMTFLVLQRRRLIGNLRALGVTRREIFKLIVSEAFLLAIVGTLIGIGLGITLGKGLLYLIAGTLNTLYYHVEAAALQVTPAQVVKACCWALPRHCWRCCRLHWKQRVSNRLRFCSDQHWSRRVAV
jgi:putative ABC transport system permease protein